MKQYGLIGYPLEHSFSGAYFAEKFRRENIHARYDNFPIRQVDQLRELIRKQPMLEGLNVTIPHKEDVIPLLDELDGLAEKVGAVNTIRIHRSGDRIDLKGYNTDVHGFLFSLRPLLKKHHKSALILGSGGASRAVQYVLAELGMDYRIVSRQPGMGELGYRDLCLPVMRKYTLIINTTPLGTHPKVEEFPDIPYDLLTENHLLYDLVYNPPVTRFLEFGRNKGAGIKNGREMLELQAEKAWEIFTS